MVEQNQAGNPETTRESDSPLSDGSQTGFGYSTVALEEKPKLVQDHFDASARRYDLMNTVMSLGVHHLWRRTAVGMMGLKPGDRVLDVCGGTADLSILAAGAIGPKGRVTLYDFTRSMIEAGRPKVVRASLSDRIRYVQGDAQEIALASGRFDAAMVGFGIRNLTDPERGFEEMHRVYEGRGQADVPGVFPADLGMVPSALRSSLVPLSAPRHAHLWPLDALLHLPSRVDPDLSAPGRVVGHPRADRLYRCDLPAAHERNLGGARRDQDMKKGS